MRLPRTVLTAALAVALSSTLLVPAADASAQAASVSRKTHVTISAKHLSGDRVELIASTRWSHHTKGSAGHPGKTRRGVTSGLRLAYETYDTGSHKWSVISRQKTYANGTDRIVGTPSSRARYRVIVKATTIGKYHYKRSVSNSVRA